MRIHKWWLTIMRVYEDHFWSECTQAKPKTQQFSASQVVKFMSRKQSQPRVELFLELNWGTRSMAGNFFIIWKSSFYFFQLPQQVPKESELQVDYQCLLSDNMYSWLNFIIITFNQNQIICIHDSTLLLSHSTKQFVWQTCKQLFLILYFVI